MDHVGPIESTRRELVAQPPAGETEDVHFTESLAAVVIEAYSRPGDIVLDPFAGYGTTAHDQLDPGNSEPSARGFVDGARQRRHGVLERF